MPTKEHKPEATSQSQISSEEESTHLNSSGEVISKTFESNYSLLGPKMASVMIVDLYLIVHMTSNDISRDGAQRMIIANDRQLSLDDYVKPPKKKQHIF